MELIFYFLFSFFAPFLWAIYLFRKDKHPEPYFWLFFAFLLGIISAVFSFHIQKYLFYFSFDKGTDLLYFLAAFVEEFLKFILIRIFILSQKVFDEPVDAMIYMVFSAFGFAFIENFGFVLRYFNSFDSPQIFSVLIYRFLGANFLHILASSLIGFGYALSLQIRRNFPFLIFLLVGTTLHFFYNWFIMNKISESKSEFLMLIPILWFVFFVVLYEINYLGTTNERRRETNGRNISG